MNRIELALKVAQLLLEVVKDIRSLADSVQAVCTAVTDGLAETEAPQKPDAPAVPLEKVRSILAEKSQAGFTAEVRAIITKHGANRLSEIDPSEYADVIKEAEVLGNAG